MQKKRPLLALLVVINMLLLGILACTSDQMTIFIPFTPTFTVTPTLPAPEGGKFEVGQELLIGPRQPVAYYLTVDPEEGAARAAQCFNGTTVDVLAVAESDGVIYYQVKCMGAVGWGPEEVFDPVE